MKRSEMVKLIFDYFDSDCFIDVEPEWMEELLTKIEQAGMLPPPYFKQQGMTQGEVDYSWEPEDE